MQYSYPSSRNLRKFSSQIVDSISSMELNQNTHNKCYLRMNKQDYGQFQILIICLSQKWKEMRMKEKAYLPRRITSHSSTAMRNSKRNELMQCSGYTNLIANLNS